MILKIKLKFRRYLNLLQQVRWFVTWVESSIISSGSNLTQNIIRETIKVEKNRDNIPTHSRVNGTLRRWLLLLVTHSFLLLRNDPSKKKHLTVKTKKLSKTLSCQKTFKMFSATGILLTSTVKRLVLEQGRFLFLKRD